MLRFLPTHPPTPIGFARTAVCTARCHTPAVVPSLPLTRHVCRCRSHFTALYRPFLEVCKKHNVHVPLRASLKQAMEEHWHYLSALNGDELLSTLQHIHDHHD